MSIMRVERVGEREVIVEVDGARKWIAWETLDQARRQPDTQLAALYQSLYRQAAAIAADGPVVVSVHHDHTHVMWVVTVRALHGGGEANYPRRADEGGTLPNQLLAACEAEDICQRLGARVARRIGFDGPAAKERARRIGAGA